MVIKGQVSSVFSEKMDTLCNLQTPTAYILHRTDKKVPLIITMYSNSGYGK